MEEERKDDESTEVFHEIIERNTIFPVTRSVTLCTGLDGQTDARIKIYQGKENGEAISECKLYHETKIENLEAKPAGQEQYDVTLDIDKDEILTVTVSSKSNPENTKTERVIYKQNNLSPQELARLVHEAAVQREEQERKGK